MKFRSVCSILRLIKGWLSIVCALVLLSCSAQIPNAAPAQTLKKNSQGIDIAHGFTAMAMWRLGIEDRTGILKGREPKFSIGPVGAVKNLCAYLTTGQTKEMRPASALSSYATVTAVDGTWSEKNGMAFYDGFFVAELKPGEREFFHLRLESDDTYSEKWISIPLDAPCVVEEGKIYDLDRVEVIVNEQIVKNNSNVFFRYQVRTPSTETSNREKLIEYYPALNFPVHAAVRECSFSPMSCKGR